MLSFLFSNWSHLIELIDHLLVHQGTFVYDIIDPLNPREIKYQADFKLEY